MRVWIGVTAGFASLLAMSARPGADLVVSLAVALWFTISLSIGLAAGVAALRAKVPLAWTCVAVALVVANGGAVGIRFTPEGWILLAWALGVVAVSCYAANRMWNVSAADCFCMLGPTAIGFFLSGAILLAPGLLPLRALLF